MGTFFAYIIKTGVCLIAYYLFYKLLFSRETFHRVNRIALVGLMLASFLIPLIHVEMSRNVVTGTVDIEQELMLLSFTTEEGAAATTLSPQQLIFAWLLIIYLVGIAVMLVRTAVVYISLARMINVGENNVLGKNVGANNIRPNGKKWRKANIADYIPNYNVGRMLFAPTIILHHEKISPFSWLNYIVVNEEDLKADTEAILTHELGHIRQKHSWDILLTELAQIVQWWNPAIWLMRRELQTIHEYEADEFVLNQGINAKQYQLLIIQKAVGCKLQSVNSLTQSSIKKRITMMLKNKSNPWAKAKYALALPVAALCALVFASPQAEEVTKDLASADWKFFGTGENVTVQTEEGIEFQAEHVEIYSKDDDEKEAVFTVVEQAPEFPGGEAAMLKFLQQNLRYPKDCAEAGIEGRVILSFIVTKDGTVTTSEEIKSPDERLTEEAKRIVLAMPKWKPGVQRGQNVNVKYVLPVTFRLSESAKNSNKTPESGAVAIGPSSNNPSEIFKERIFLNGTTLTVTPFEDTNKILRTIEIDESKVFENKAYFIADQQITKEEMDEFYKTKKESFGAILMAKDKNSELTVSMVITKEN